LLIYSIENLFVNCLVTPNLHLAEQSYQKVLSLTIFQ
jgi:hypothetical protein